MLPVLLVIPVLMSSSPAFAKATVDTGRKQEIMKLQKSLLQKYNRPENLLVISSYPKKGEIHSQGVCGLSSFTKNTLLAIRNQYPPRKIIVLTMTTDKEEMYEEDDMLIIRCFKRNKPLSYITLFSYLKQFTAVPPLLVEFEFASFGNFVTTSFLPVFLAMAKVIGKKITVVVHQVVTDLASLSGHIGVEKHTTKLTALSTLLRTYYQLLGKTADYLVVLEEQLKIRLAELVDEKKIIVIPHGVHTPQVLLKKQRAKKMLNISKNEIVLLYFGYITWYKGADILVKAVQQMRKIDGKKVRLIIAGGATPTQKDKNHYQKYLEKVTKLTAKTKHITITGFVREEDIAMYYAASDLVLFPYRTFMSSSGPLALALAYNKPFLVSDTLKEAIEAQDMQQVFSTVGITNQHILFSLTAKSMKKRIAKALSSSVYTKMQKAATLLAQKRSYEILATHYAGIVFEPRKQSVKDILVTPSVSA